MARTQDLTAQEVIDICATYMNEKNVAFVKKALDYATHAHRNQVRLSGEAYIVHPIQVAGILAQLQSDPATVATGFLHDVVEDTEYTLEDIEREFGSAVAFLVDGVTKLGKVKFQSKEEALAENHRKMLLAMAKDMRIVMVKLADRLHNMRTLKFQKPEKQVEKSQEAIDIYAPLADRIGMNLIKWELEDIALRYINQAEYYRIVRLMDSKRNEREKYIQEAINEINIAVEDMSIKADVYGRPKHIYSIYRKMVDQNKDFDHIYDLLAIRVLVDTIKDCYSVLGIIHTKWKPMPGRFKDYIAMPKANMYQSIHTTIIGPYGKPVEIQIRTHQMHEVAEYGVAAHWAYKEGKTEKVQVEDTIERQMKWFKDLVELQDDAQNASEFMDFVKEDIFKDQVYIFSPKGDVFELPAGSGPIDFAYHIHTEVGNKIIGAKINGNIVPLNYTLKNGDIIEILTNPNSNGPSRDWLKMTHTSKARNRIKRYFKLLDRDRYSEQGQNLLDRDLKLVGSSVKALTKKNREKELLERFNFNTIEDLYAAVGLNEISPQTIINYLGLRPVEEASESKNNLQTVKKELPAHKVVRTVHESGVVVNGVENLMVRLSRCCNPVPGDEIVGYITRGRGVSIHHKNCPNLLNEPELMNRTIDVEWEQQADLTADYETEIKITGFDRSGLINDVLHVVNHTVKNLRSVNGKVDSNSTATVTVKIAISNTTQLNDLMNKLRNIPDVYEVNRVSNN
ncbi:bifunctional (p)ppGpp synthetase/guanosine-3',5'-bis(diphosphate) 3'-pyrophosphohydrolase [Aerococcaceae bacterium zg-ZJ1578]|uniref:RelA/SpoT family protein n=1 Tax=Aerococcaceae TaxID=186827 RepID=UPI0013B934F0|nr:MULTISPECIES: bifunctional (p)ppGpp synthetase/guanosine-3',5'-bis(diphosphate) 3'-pyrophosphohydrolase [unclassified Facklamia]MBK0347935.1 bifunctional (p)ppGpp synthetase/guanosine-3',5'-bis(diphosphate) 3'-pyrophosphohydrolase [Aerococcaceae bacterium zg-1578]MBR7926880.1 bifunctional (p)ppGpp synthetase/guanosine-3',5'-bis(diphosphate) 3'-pyrophosphohydrolase [Aerococcaceae bacterium zg-ZUI334]MBS4460973.1 bifunctional (p)ppGpp synthetase/guanosine-3',5'-bis(diphosphate) 3'-pyrophosphohy